MNAGPAAKRDRQRAIREIIVRDPIGSQRELVERSIERRLRGDPGDREPRHRRARPRQGRPRRPPRLRLAEDVAGSAAVRSSDERLRRILADIPVTVGRSGLDPARHRVAGHGERHRPGDRRVDADRAGRHARRRQHAARPVRRRGRASSAGSSGSRPLQVRAGAPAALESPMKKVVLAYSGGLGHVGRRRLAARSSTTCEVVTLTVDVGGGSLREGVERRAMLAGASRAYVVDARERFVTRLRLAAPPGERAVPGRLPAGDGARPAAHRPAPRRGRPARGRRRGRPRLHRQGQRPGPLRRRGPRPRSGARGRRADAGRDGPDPRPGDRLRDRARDRDPDHEGVAVLDRRRTSGAARARPASSRTRGSRRRPTPTSGRSRRRPPRRRSRSRSSSRAAIPVAIDGERLAPVELVERLHDAGRRPRRRPHRPRRGPRSSGSRAARSTRRPAATILHAAHRALEGLTPHEGHAPVQPASSPNELAQLTYDGLWFSRAPPRPARLRRVVPAGRLAATSGSGSTTARRS